jgi:hypothetical protein
MLLIVSTIRAGADGRLMRIEIVLDNRANFADG